MQQTVLFKVPGRPSTRPLVILTGLNLEAKSSTPISVRLTRALAAAWRWTRSNCTPRRIFSAVFSAKVSTVVAFIIIAAMWWHNIVIDDVLQAQRAVATDCLFGLPWGLVWAVRLTLAPVSKKGGEK